MKNFLAITLAAASFILMIISTWSMKAAGITFVVLLILELTSLISIGLWVIWYPIIMLVGGLISVVINFIILVT